MTQTAVERFENACCTILGIYGRLRVGDPLTNVQRKDLPPIVELAEALEVLMAELPETLRHMITLSCTRLKEVEWASSEILQDVLSAALHAVSVRAQGDTKSIDQLLFDELVVSDHDSSELDRELRGEADEDDEDEDGYGG